MRVDVRTETVGRRDLTATVSASGEVRPKRFVDISSNVSGRITHMKVREGDAVKRGQVLARIDSTRFEADVRQGEAALGARRADLERAIADLAVEQLSFERAKSTHAQQLISDEAFDQARARVQIEDGGRRVDAASDRTAGGPAHLESRQPGEDHGHCADGRCDHQPRQRRGRDGDRRAELSAHGHDDRRGFVGDGVRGHGRRDRHQERATRSARTDRSRRVPRPRDHGKRHGDRILRDPRGAGTAGAVSSGGTASNQAKISRSSLPSSTRPRCSARASTLPPTSRRER